MYTYTPSDKPNTRIDVADILRGIAIAGIILIHFIEHLNFYSFPEPFIHPASVCALRPQGSTYIFAMV